MAQAFTNADVQSLAHKLTQFNQTLTPGEQAALTEAILRGAPKSKKEVEGYFDRRPNEGAVGVQEGTDPLSPIFNIFGSQPQTRPWRDRPEDRR